MSICLTDPISQRNLCFLINYHPDHGKRLLQICINLMVDICWLLLTISVISSKSSGFIQPLQELWPEHFPQRSHMVLPTLVTDNGLQFMSSEFAAFCAERQINHVTSSPYFPSFRMAGLIRSCWSCSKDCEVSVQEMQREWNIRIQSFTRLEKYANRGHDFQSVTKIYGTTLQDTSSDYQSTLAS